MPIEPLRANDIPEALRLITSVFPRDTEHAKLTLRAYAQGKVDPHWIEHQLTDLRFWIIRHDEHIVGMIGLYEKSTDENEASWISWFCVAPQVRRQGIGRKLLEYLIAESHHRGKKYLRLYTSTAPEEEDAQLLYETYGFRETRREPEPNTAYQLIYRELRL